MTRVLDLGALQIGDRVQDTLLVLEAEQKSFDGGAYTVLTFGNATGRLPSAPFFDKDLPYVEGVRRGHVVQVIGEIAEYRGRRQLRVTAPLRLLPDGAVDLSQLLPTVGDVTRYWEVLDGVLLHDIGKLESYRWDGVFEYTDAGHLLGHVALGALMLERRLALEAERPCSGAERDVLLHLVLAHHGRLEFGSPVSPMTLEAEVLHWADNASAKTSSMGEALREAEAFGDSLVSQRKFWQLDYRRAYRGVSDWGATPGGE